MSLDAVGDEEVTCAATRMRACSAAPSMQQIQRTMGFDQRPFLASTDLTVASADGHAIAPSKVATVSPDVDESTLVQQANNLIANLISVPVENDWDMGIGPAHATRYLANIQPVIPFSLTEDWNLITRTIVPVIYQQALVNNPNAPSSLRKNQSGIGDIEQSFLFSPKKEFDGWITGAGPVGYYPTATDSVLGLGKWGAGPTFVVLRQEHGFTYGLLANQIWSVGGEQGRGNFSSMYLQPFLLYTTKSNTSLGVDSESSHDWYDDQWIVPLNFQIRQLVKIGKLPVQFTAGYRY